jgi:carbon monoxide dehydrogenase subunit G
VLPRFGAYRCVEDGVRISGYQTLAATPEKAYALMRDPKVLARAIPGCEALEKIGEDEYRMKMVLASFSGAFEGRVRIADQAPPQSFRMIVEGSGQLGFIKGDGLLKLAASGAGTEVSYEGDAHVGGTMAVVGQRLIDSTAKTLIKKFFEKLADEASAADYSGRQ